MKRCLDCPRAVAPRARRCPACRVRAARAAQAAFRARHRPRLNALARAYQRRRRGAPGPGLTRVEHYRCRQARLEEIRRLVLDGGLPQGRVARGLRVSPAFVSKAVAKIRAEVDT